MTEIDVEAHHESVLQFVLSLSQDPAGTGLRVNGKMLFHVVPIVPPTSSPEVWTEELNTRRRLLIEKEIGGTIDPAVAIELENLQAGLRRHQRLVSPMPLAETRRMLESLERKATG